MLISSKIGFPENVIMLFKRRKYISRDSIKRILFARGVGDILEYTNPGNQKQQDKLANMMKLKALLWRLGS